MPHRLKALAMSICPYHLTIKIMPMSAREFHAVIVKKAWPNTVFARALANAIQRSAQVLHKNKHAFIKLTAIISFASVLLLIINFVITMSTAMLLIRRLLLHLLFQKSWLDKSRRCIKNSASALVFVAIRNPRIAGSRSLTRRMNFKCVSHVLVVTVKN